MSDLTAADTAADGLEPKACRTQLRETRNPAGWLEGATDWHHQAGGRQ